MKRTIFLIMTLALAACTTTPEPTEQASNTDAIAGYWSGEATGELDAGQELQLRDVGVAIKPDCTTGKVCGKFSEDGHCPGDIVLKKIDGNRFYFLSETASGARGTCGAGNIRMIDLELRPDGTIDFVYHNGEILTGILHQK